MRWSTPPSHASCTSTAPRLSRAMTCGRVILLERSARPVLSEPDEMYALSRDAPLFLRGFFTHRHQTCSTCSVYHTSDWYPEPAAPDAPGGYPGRMTSLLLSIAGIKRSSGADGSDTNPRSGVLVGRRSCGVTSSGMASMMADCSDKEFTSCMYTLVERETVLSWPGERS